MVNLKLSKSVLYFSTSYTTMIFGEDEQVTNEIYGSRENASKLVSLIKNQGYWDVHIGGKKPMFLTGFVDQMVEDLIKKFGSEDEVQEKISIYLENKDDLESFDFFKNVYLEETES